MDESVLQSKAQTEDLKLDVSLRPKSLTDFIGQKELKEKLSIFTQAAKLRGEALDHTLFSGPPGLGKTSLAHVMAHELGVQIVSLQDRLLKKLGIWLRF